MSEILCPLCNAPSPEQALYCQHCGQPLRCQNCRAEILPKAHACIQCGKPIPERADNEQIHVGMGLVPPGYNHLSLHETADMRDLDVMITNEAIVHIGDFLPSLLETRTKRYNGSSVNQQPQNQTDLVEVASEV